MSSKLILFSLDKSYKYTQFNALHKQVMKEIWGAEIKLGENILDFITNDMDKIKAKKNFDQALSGKYLVLREEYGNEDKHRGYYENTYTPLVDNNNNVIGLNVAIKEVEIDDNAKQDILKKDSLLESITQNIEEGIYRTTDKKGLVYANESLWRLFGYENFESFRSVDGYDLYAEKSRRDELTELIRKKGSFSNEEVLLKKKNGETFWALMSGHIVTTENGETYYDGIVNNIDQRKKIEKKNRENEARLNSISENINEGIFRSDKNGLVTVNKSFLKMFGFREDTRPKDIDVGELYVNEKDKKERKLIYEGKKGETLNSKLTLKKITGETFIAYSSSKMHVDEEGNIFFDGAIRDITKEEEALKIVQEKEQLLRSIGDNINEAIYRSELSKGLIYVNKAFVQMFGYESAHEILSGKPINLYAHSADRKRLGDLLVEKGKSINEEVLFRKKNGELFWGAMNAIKVEGLDGEIYFDGAIRDITESKISEQKLKKQNDIQSLIIEVSGHLIKITDKTFGAEMELVLQIIGNFVKTSRVYIAALEDDAYEIKFFTRKNGGISTPSPEYLKKLKSFQLPYHLENKQFSLGLGFKKPSTQLPGVVALRSFPIYLDGIYYGSLNFESIENINSNLFDPDLRGLFKLLTSMITNVLLRMKDQDELKVLLEHTNSQNERLRNFSFMISHNIRSSVANIMGLTNIIQDEPTKEMFDILHGASIKLDETIKSISDLIHFENKRDNFIKEPILLSEVVHTILQDNDHWRFENKVDFILDIDNTLTINSYPAYLESVVYNLISNAVKYGVTESSKRIEIYAQIESDTVVFYVRDHGIGIDLEKYRNKLFELGSRLTPEIADGDGLGLYMVKNQIKALGGKLELDSSPKKGSTFKVLFKAN